VIRCESLMTDTCWGKSRHCHRNRGTAAINAAVWLCRLFDCCPLLLL